MVHGNTFLKMGRYGREAFMSTGKGLEPLKNAPGKSLMKMETLSIP